MAESNTIIYRELNQYLFPGMKMRVKLEFGPDDFYQFTTRLLGFKPDHSLILEFPRAAIDDLVFRNISNTTVIVRGISNTDMGHIVAFKSSIIQSILQPFPLLFIRTPHHFETKAIRQHKRIKLSLPITLNDLSGKHWIEGTLTDFSVSGCGVYLDAPVHDPQTRFLHKDSQVIVHCTLTDCIDPEIISRVANVSCQANGISVGLNFTQTMPLNEPLKNLLFKHTILDHFSV